jgi:hypothetical protein
MTFVKIGEGGGDTGYVTECREENGNIILRRWFNSLSGWAKEVTNGKGSSGWKTGSCFHYDVSIIIFLVEARGKKMKEHRKKILPEEPKRRVEELTQQLENLVAQHPTKRQKLSPDDFSETKRGIIDILQKCSIDLRGTPEWDDIYQVEEWAFAKNLEELKNILQTKKEWTRVLQFYHYLFGIPEPLVQLNMPDPKPIDEVQIKQDQEAMKHLDQLTVKNHSDEIVRPF